MRTVLFAFLDILFCMIMIIILMVNPDQDEKDILQPPGNMFVYTNWVDDGSKSDVDTWLLGPKMGLPVGYDRKDSAACNLVKDDLGSAGGSSGINYENIFCRDALDGKYVINLHAFENQNYPVVVNVQIALIVNGKTELLFDEQVTLLHYKQEVTVVRFELKDGKVVPGSVHHTFVSLFKMDGV